MNNSFSKQIILNPSTKTSFKYYNETYKNYMNSCFLIHLKSYDAVKPINLNAIPQENIAKKNW